MKRAKGHVNTIQGQTNGGKTEILLDLAMGCMLRGLDCLFITFEETRFGILGRLEPGEKILGNMDVVPLNPQHHTFKDIVKTVEGYAELDAVFIDGLHLVPLPKNGSYFTHLSAQCDMLRELAKEFNVAIVQTACASRIKVEV